MGPTFRPVKRLGFVISDGHTQPSEIAYVRRLPSDIALFPTNYRRRLKAVGDKALPSEITYFRRFNSYVRRFWPSDVVPFTVVYDVSYNTSKGKHLAYCLSGLYDEFTSGHVCGVQQFSSLSFLFQFKRKQSFSSIV
jgi:hypothetical protein